MQMGDLIPEVRQRLEEDIDRRWDRLLKAFPDEPIVKVTISSASLRFVDAGGIGHFIASVGEKAKSGFVFDVAAFDENQLRKLNRRKKHRNK